MSIIKKILIAANDKEIADDLAHNLKNLNYEVIGFADSRSEATIMTGQLKPDIVLMDLELPGGDENVEAATLIQKNYSIPVVFIKTHLDDDTTLHTDISEPYGYIIKPVNKSILHAVVSNALRLHDSDKKLYEKNQMYNAILNIPRESLSLIEPDGTILEVNESFIRHFNKKREELIGSSIYDLFPFEIAEQKKIIVREVLLNGKTAINEFEHNGKWLSNIIFPIFDLSGVIIKIGISSLDITGYKQAKDKLYETEALFNAFLENSPIYLFFKDDNLRFLRLSANFQTLLGKPLHELLGKTMFEIYPLDTAKIINESDLHTLHSKEKSFAEFELNGMQFETMKFPIQIENKQPFLAGYSIDITERNRLENELENYRNRLEEIVQERTKNLKKSEEYSQALISGMHTGLSIHNDKSEIISFNDNASEIFGFAGEQIIGRTAASRDYILTNEDGKAIKPDMYPVNQVLSKKAAIKNLIYGIKHNANSDTVWVEMNAVPLFNDDGSVREVMVNSYDITERKNAELEILNLNKSLMKMQEVERQHIAKELHDGVGQSLLAAKMNLDLCLQNPAESKDQLNMSCNFIDKTIQELRDLYTGIYPSILSDLGIESTIRWCVENSLKFNNIKTEMNLKLQRKLSDELTVNLYRIVQEIISNILKHSQASAVKIQLYQMDEETVLIFEDNGIGIAANTIKKNNMGQGISNMKQRIKNFHGKLLIESPAVGGTKITIRIKDLENE